MATVVNYTTVNGVILSENRAGIKRDYMRDGLGSTIALLDSTQTQTDTYFYWLLLAAWRNPNVDGSDEDPIHVLRHAGIFR